MIVRGAEWAGSRTFLNGWINGDIGELSLTGASMLPGNVTYTMGVKTSQFDPPTHYQRTYAHELLHNLGRIHPTTASGEILHEVGWDVGARLWNNPSSNGVPAQTRRVKPLTDPLTGNPFLDVMATRTGTTNTTSISWIDPFNYQAVLNHPALRPRLTPDPLEPPGGLAAIRGIFNPEGTALVRLNQVYRFPWQSEATSLKQTGPFRAIVRDTNGVITRRRFSAVTADSNGRMAHGAFSVMVPVDPLADIASLHITNADGTVVYGALERSEGRPQVFISSPNPGDQLGGTTEVRWAPKDPDSSDEELLYQVAYSPNRGRSWVPLGVDIPGTEQTLTFDSSEIQRSSGKGIIRVFVSDGLNTAFEDVSGLSR
jgi:hypothetical protein